VSKLRRDRRALRTARYVRRCETLTGTCYTGTGRWGMASYRAMHWLYARKAWDKPREGDQLEAVSRYFCGQAWLSGDL